MRPDCAAFATTPWWNGPLKKSGKMVSIRKIIVGQVGNLPPIVNRPSIQLQQSIRQRYFNPSLLHVDLSKNGLRKRDQQFLALRRFNLNQQRPAGLLPAVHSSYQSDALEYLATHQIGLIILPVGDLCTRLHRNS